MDVKTQLLRSPAPKPVELGPRMYSREHLETACNYLGLTLHGKCRKVKYGDLTRLVPSSIPGRKRFFGET